MENIQEEVEEPKENPQEDEELLEETPADEVRSSIIERYGLDNEVDDELITKLVEDQVESGKKLSTAIKQRSTAIKQKIGWRTKATAQKEQKPEEKPQPQASDEEIDKILDQKLEERELQSLDFSDELKDEIRTYAKAGGLTVKKVLQSDYFKFLKQQEEAKQKVEEAAIGGKHKAPSVQDFSVDNPPSPDMSTKEGQEEWENYKKFLKSQ